MSISDELYRHFQGEPWSSESEGEPIVAEIAFLMGIQAAMLHPGWARAIYEIDEREAGGDPLHLKDFEREDVDRVVAAVPIVSGVLP